MGRTEPGNGGGVENVKRLAEEWGAEEKASREVKNGMFRKPYYGLCFPRLSKPNLLVPPLFSFHPPWTMQGGLETDEELRHREVRSPASGYKVRKWPKRPKVSRLPTLVVPLGVKFTNRQGAVEYKELFLCDAT